MSANPDTVILPYGAGFVTLAQNFSFSLKLLLSLYVMAGLFVGVCYQQGVAPCLY